MQLYFSWKKMATNIPYVLSKIECDQVFDSKLTEVKSENNSRKAKSFSLLSGLKHSFWLLM